MKIAISFINFGTYHYARLRAAAKKCQQLGWDLTAIQATDDVLDHPWGFEQTESSLRTITLLPARARGAHAQVDAFTRRAGKRMTEALAELRPDVVFLPGWSHPVARAGLQWSLNTGAESVIMSESTAHDSARVWWREAYKGMLVRSAAAALVGGRPHREYLQRLGMRPEAIFLGYDVVDNDYFSAQADAARSRAAAIRLDLNLPDRYFLASSRFIEKKNLSRLIDGFDAYRRRAGHSAWHLIVLGDGPLRAQLETQVREADLGRLVRLPGFATYDRVPQYLGLAEAFVHASTTEQWGLVVNEAMAAGLPVIVSDRCGCAPDLVRHEENGYTFDPFAVGQIAERLWQLSSLAGEKRAAMSAQSRALIANWAPARFAQGAIDAAMFAQATSRNGLRRQFERALLASTTSISGALIPTMRGA